MKTVIDEGGVGVRETLHGLFNTQASATPDAVAVIDNGGLTTYRGLASHAARWTDDLARRGLQRGDVVGLCVRRTAELMALMLGVMKIGGISVPVDLDLPSARRRQIFSECAPKLVVITDEQSDSGYTVTSAESLPPDVRLRPQRGDGPRERGGSDNVWCLLYTSGVTGKPKGVRVTHAQVIAYLSWMWQAFPFRPGDKSLVNTSPMLIASAWDHFGPLLKGVPALLLAENDAVNAAAVVRQCIEHGVTHVSASPGLWQALLDRPVNELSRWISLRMGISRGDQLRVDTVRSWTRAFPAARLLNAYGSTECWRPTTFDTRELAPDADRVPIGRPLPGVSAYICDDALHELTTGEVGELCVAGVCVGAGYHGLPELTAERFVPNPFGSGHPSTLFRTGDLGVRNEDGTLMVVGRSDQQVNIRGYRVEVGDVECALRLCRGVREAVVVPRRHPGGTMELAAYIVPQTDVDVDVADIRSELELYVPQYMLPSACVTTRALPMTRSGKIDRQALLLQSLTLEKPNDHLREQWRTSTETQLAQLWMEIIGCGALGRDDGFLDVGGDSIMAMRLVGRISERFGIEVSLDDLFENAAVPQVAAAIDGRMSTER